MSEGVRIPLAQAEAVIAGLREKWGLDPARVFVAGSVRRRCPDVGDVDILAPAVGPSARDELYERIVATIDNPPAPTSIFQDAPPPRDDAFATAMRGLKPAFLAADLVVRAWKGRVALKVQIARYTRENLGWMMIEKTGPAAFGRWFLTRWKQHRGIPTRDARFRASIDNHLVGLDQKVIAVETEDEAFRMCGLNPTPPEHREAFIRRVEAMSTTRRTA